MKKPNSFIGLFVYWLLGLFIIGLLGYLIFVYKLSSNNLPSNKTSVTTSFYPLYFFTSQIGGDKVVVKNITPAGSEPHDYDPSTRDITDIEKSKLLILNGGVESWGKKIKQSLEKDTKVITVGNGLITKQFSEEGETIPDPHIWLDPVLAKQEAKKIANALIFIDPPSKQTYENNYQQLASQLDQLDKQFSSELKTCTTRDFVTSHAAFAYLANRYQLKQISISGLSPDAEPSLKELTNITHFAQQNKIKYIFFESLVSPKLAQTIAQEVGAQTLVLDPLEGLSNDDIKQGKNYFTVMRQNLTNLEIALECKK